MRELLSVDWKALSADPTFIVFILVWFIWYVTYRKRMLPAGADFSQLFMYRARVIAAVVTVGFSLVFYNAISLEAHKAKYQKAHSVVVDAALPGDNYIQELVADPRTFETSQFRDILTSRRQLFSTDDLDPASVSKMEAKSAGALDSGAGAFLFLYCIPLANHGYAFHHRELRDLFSHCDWYHPSTPNLSDAVHQFTPYEQRNSKVLLKAIETADPSANSSWMNNL